ncbi:MAG TPA: enoyl-CoA hydratase/isomerase family protein [Pseudolabrys sp.]|jgi:enoyl-CoA hydratase|nr:enoyl-CoA hydratase/isomerase family protein [Pseudolabrys sp.]
MIDVSVNDGIAIVTMGHGKANVLDIESCDTIAARFIDLRKSDVRAVVLTGQGQIFSAGVNLKRISEGGADYIRQFLPALHRLYDAVFFHPKPLIAAINGHAIAGGCVLACCADRRIMARDSGRIGVTEILVGVPFPALAFEIMRHATPPYFFTETVLSGATFSAEAAAHRGWINETVEPALLMDRAMAAARELASLSPAAFTQTKMQIRQPVIERLRRDGDATDKAVTEIWAAPATLGYIRDYAARTLKKS